MKTKNVEIRVVEAMTRGVIWVKPGDTIQKIARIMKENNIESVIVIDNGKGVGVITERDLVWKVIANGKDQTKMYAKDVMSQPLITIDADEKIDLACKMMVEKDIRRLAVSKSNKIIGIITVMDILNIEPTLHLIIEEQGKWDISDLNLEEGTISGICEMCGEYSDDLKNVDGRLICPECRGD